MQNMKLSDQCAGHEMFTDQFELPDVLFYVNSEICKSYKM